MFIICELLLVAGVEVASAKTQTSKMEGVSPHSAGLSAPSSQFVVGMSVFTSVYTALGNAVQAATEIM